MTSMNPVGMADLTDEQIEGLAQDWLEGRAEEPVDWDRYLRDIEEAMDIDLPNTYDAPLIKRIQRITRRVKREMTD